MEQKKTLWIIAASGVFLLVVIGAALLLNAPTSNNAPATASITTVERPSAEWKAPSTEAVSEALPAEGTVAAEESGFAFERIESETAQAVSSENALASEDKLAAAQPAEAEKHFSIEVNNASTGITPASKGGELAMAQASKPKADTIYTAPKTTASKPASTSVKTAAAPAKTTAKPAAPVTAPKYWVQAASFTNKKSADTARSTLDDNRIPAEVFTYKDGKDNLFYRVRVGPYTTKSEAEYWKNRICMIDLFKETQSYVTQVN